MMMNSNEGMERIKELVAKVKELGGVISKKYGLEVQELNLEDVLRDPNFFEECYCIRSSFEATHLGVTGKVPDRLCRQYRRHSELLIEMISDIVRDRENGGKIFDNWFDSNYEDMIAVLTAIAEL